MNRIDYRERLGWAREYMHQHLADDLSVERLAAVSCLSAYHWHRLYHAFYGETAAATVRRLRLGQAAGLLATTELTVHEIASRSGYPNLQAFTRAFRDAHGLPPATFRRTGNHRQFVEPQAPMLETAFDIRIETMAPMDVIAVPHSGSYMGIGAAFDRLYGWLLAHGRSPGEARHFGIFHNDPFVEDSALLRSHATVLLADPPPLEEGITRMTVAGGTCVVLRYRGPYSSMHAAYEWLFGRWVVDSGYAMADAPLVEEYLNDPATTAPADLHTDIRMLLQPFTTADADADYTCTTTQSPSMDTGNVSTDSSSSSARGSTVTS